MTTKLTWVVFSWTKLDALIQIYSRIHLNNLFFFNEIILDVKWEKIEKYLEDQ